MRAGSEMGCRELVELVSDYIEGALPPEDVARFEAHLEECDGCARYVDQMRETVSALGQLTPESLTPEAEHRMLMAFRDWQSRR